MRLKKSLFPQTSAALDPVEAAKAQANRLAERGSVDEAIELLTGWLEKHPGRSDLLIALARILLEGRRLIEAIEVLIVLDAHLPTNGEILKMLGTVYGQTRQFTKSASYLERARHASPGDADVVIELAKSYEQTGQQELAVATILNAVGMRPKDPSLRCTAASLLHHSGRNREASRILLEDPAIASLPDVRLMEAMLFPVIPESAEEIGRCRDHYRSVLADLMSEGATIDDPGRAIRQTNFFLGYHGSHDRELIELWSETLLKICPNLAYVSPNLQKRGGARDRIKVGFVSSNMRNHSVGRVLNRFLKEFDRNRFEVVLFELPGKFEGGQELGRSLADQTVFVPGNLDDARKSIEAERPDILVFPDFVLDPFNDQLAFSRLAPVQCSTWGHPGTSGRPSIDYWISCGDWDPPGNEIQYSERLIRFTAPPMIATALERPEPILSRADLGLPDGRLYGCPQSIYKLHPEFDKILAEILERDPEGFVVVIGGVQPYWLRQFEERFRRQYASVASRIIMLPHLDTKSYLSLLAHCSVSLDPIHFGGANTSMEAFTMGLPVVTRPGDQLRNRQTLSFYRRMGYTELVVESAKEYVDLALKLGCDEPFRATASAIVQDRCSVIFDTVDVTREWEAFFEATIQAVEGNRCLL